MFSRCDCPVAGANGNTSVDLFGGDFETPWTWTEVQQSVDCGRLS
jgi:hypothetical protein